MRIYLVRHGQTGHNQKNMYMDSSVTLSKEGEKQAELLAKRMKKISFDLILVSPYKRAEQTAEAIKKETNIEVQTLDELKEIIRPSSFLGKTYEDPHVLQAKKQMNQNIDDPKYRYSDEENFFDLKSRAQKVIEKIKEYKDADLLLVSHEGFIKVLTSYMMFQEDLTSKLFDHLYDFLRFQNTGITVLEFDGENFKLITWNDHAHLG